MPLYVVKASGLSFHVEAKTLQGAVALFLATYPPRAPETDWSWPRSVECVSSAPVVRGETTP